MSFILEALKKVERQKTAAGAVQLAEGALDQTTARGAGIRELPRMAGIAVVSAGVTAGFLWFLAERGPKPGATNPPAQVPAYAPGPQGGSEVEQLLPLLPVDGADIAAEPASIEPRMAERPTTAQRAAQRHDTAQPAAERQAREHTFTEPSVSERPGRNDDLPSSEAEGTDRTSEVAWREPSEPADPEQPSGPPVLVLQGTSALRGEPVAVINDQRVFEGDRIQGALVIRIEERAVELEFDGQRFTIRL